MIENILLFMLVGFVAQIIDGALGMAYGVSSTTFLLSLGVPPAVASASVHTAEMATTAASGLSHLRFGNVDRKLIVALILPGVIGGVLGAYVLTQLPTQIIKPAMAIYLLAMGALIFIRAMRGKPEEKREPRHLTLLALVGGFSDAIGGGGWGPIVTSTLVADGQEPRFTIGSVNASEFFITLSESVTFIAVLGATLLESWATILGLLLGGVIAAPLAAYVCRRMPARALMILVGVLITLLSIRTLVLTFMG